jgi:8-oxo-dGTP diphosphatase
MYSGDYIPPTLTVDGIIFQLEGGHLSVLLIQRTQEPFKGAWALPGGYNTQGETTREALARVVERKAGVRVDDLNLVEQLYTFDTVARDPRGHAVSVTYLGLGREIFPQFSDTTQNPQFFPIDHLPELAYDHAQIIEYAHERLRSKITYTNAIYALLPGLFTLSQLQAAYEAVLGRELDKRNFRKKFLSLDLIEETDQILKEGAHRPARLYKFCKPDLQALERSFD